MTKQALRKLYLEKRLALTAIHSEALNKQLANTFFKNVSVSHINTLHIFLPIVKNNEPNTWLIINRIKKDFPQITIILPRIAQGNSLEHIVFENENQLEFNKWGISEPVRGKHANISDIDTVVIPLLAFDKHGNRVGYGKGFYDTFLSQCNSNCKKIGLSLFATEEIIEDIERHDQLINCVITPTKIFNF